MHTDDNTYHITKHIESDEAALIVPNDVTTKKYDVERSLKFQIEQAEKLGVKKLYISFYWHHDPVMSGMMGTQQDDKWVPASCDTFTSYPTIACPTPHFNQLVYKYDHGHIEVLWFIPSHDEFWSILRGEMQVTPEVKFWVTSAHNGELFKFVDRENQEDTIGKQVKVIDPNTIA